MSTFRFLHTSDVHLDTSFSGAGFTTSQGQVLRAGIRETFRGIVNRAIEAEVDALIIAGDLYEADRITPDTVKFLDAEFQRLRPRAVLIAPGNHDPYSVTSPYHQHAWPDNVRIFRGDEPTCFDLGAARIHGLAHAHADERRNLLRDLMSSCKAKDGGAFHIAVVHASDTRQLIGGKQTYAPFHPDDLRQGGFHYVALGHYHRCYRVDEPTNGAAGLARSSPGDQSVSIGGAWYSGCPQARGFDEPEDCSCLLVTMKDAHDPSVDVVRLPTGGRRFLSGDIDCASFEHSEAIVSALRAWCEQRQTHADVVRLRLMGEQNPSLRLELDGLLEQCRGAAFQMTLIDALRPAYDLDTLAAEDSLRGAFVRHLRDRLDEDNADRRLIERALHYGLEAFADRELLIS